MRGMITYASSFNSDISNWNVSRVTNMKHVLLRVIIDLHLMIGSKKMIFIDFDLIRNFLLNMYFST